MICHGDKKSPKSNGQAGLNGDARFDARSPPPRSFASPAPSAHSRGTQKSRVTEKQSTAYPPLPPSQTQSNIGSASAVKYQRTYSRAPSLSPSDSPSQMKPQRNVVRSVGREPSLPPVPPSDGDSHVLAPPGRLSSQVGIITIGCSSSSDHSPHTVMDQPSRIFFTLQSMALV